jgi:hypothetical protein
VGHLGRCRLIERVKRKHGGGMWSKESPVFRPPLLVPRLHALLPDCEYVARCAQNGGHVPRSQLLDGQDISVGHGTGVGTAVHYDGCCRMVGECRKLWPDGRVAVKYGAAPEVTVMCQGIASGRHWRWSSTEQPYRQQEGHISKRRGGRRRRNSNRSRRPAAAAAARPGALRYGLLAFLLPVGLLCAAPAASHGGRRAAIYYYYTGRRDLLLLRRGGARARACDAPMMLAPARGRRGMHATG